MNTTKKKFPNTPCNRNYRFIKEVEDKFFDNRLAMGADIMSRMPTQIELVSEKIKGKY